MHKPLTADSTGFFFSSDCHIYKYKTVSFNNLFYLNHLINLFCGCVQKPRAASAPCSGEVCVRTRLQKALGRLWHSGCQRHSGDLSPAWPWQSRTLGADVGPLAALGEREKQMLQQVWLCLQDNTGYCLCTFTGVLNLSWDLGLGKKEGDADSL